MPALVAPLLGFALGALLSVAARGELARAPGEGAFAKALLIVAVHALLVYAPAVAYLLATAPDWCFSYVVDTERFPPGTEIAIVLAVVASSPLGFTIAARWLRPGRIPTSVSVSAPPVLGALVMLGAVLPRLGADASFAQYHGDFGVGPVVGGRLGYALAWLSLALAAATTIAWRGLRQIAKERRAT